MFFVGEQTKKWAHTRQLTVDYAEESISTNDKAKASDIPVDLILTDYQMSGRGRGERTWTSPPLGTGLLSSWVFYLDFAPQPILTCLIGLALYQALKKTWPPSPLSLKAPNDIYIGRQKLAGLLVENINQGQKNQLIVGLGLNVFAAPEGATYLAKMNPVEKENWGLFLNDFYSEIKKLLAKPLYELNPQQQKALLEALNQHPLLSEPYLQIQSDGSLSNSSKTISWFDL